MVIRSSLLAALTSRNTTSLIQCVNELSANNALTETMTDLSNLQLQELWDSVQSILAQALQDTNTDCASTVELLTCVTKLADGTFTDEKGSDVFLPQSLVEVAILVHGIFPSLTSEHNALKDAISRIFEHWWAVEGRGREELMGNTLVYLLNKSTGPKSTKADVARVYSICRVLDSINLDHADAGILVDLMLHCCVHPQFLNSPQGIKFLVYVFTLSPDLTKKLHQTIKNHLPATPVAMQKQFSEVYFRAWQEAKSQTMREVLEHDCIQDLMYRAVHARRGGQSSLAKILFRILSFLHKKKTQKGAEAMLSQLYEPILWRSLMVANSDVRINAATLMFDIFPLQDASLNREQTDAALQKQFDIMHDLLTDPVPEVRLTAINGVGRVLNIYWELIPADVIKCFVRKLVEDLAYDASSPAVREAVLKVMHQLCDNHLCIPMLQTVLPLLQNFVHDASEKVRVAMIDLLLKVKGLRAIKFWNLVPLEHILACLEVDSAPVVRRIMKLIQPSFVPLHESTAEQINRCITLIKLNMAAARQFFLSLPRCLSLEDIVKYITLLCKSLIESAWKLNRRDQQSQPPDNGDVSTSSDDIAAGEKTARSSSKSKKARKSNKSSTTSASEDCNDDDSVPRNDEEFVAEMNVFCGLVEAIYLMHTVILSELDSPANKDIKNSLAKKLSVMVRELMTVSKDPKLDQALIAMASHLPSRALPHIAQNVFKRLKSPSCLDDGMDTKLMVKSLVLWGKAESLIQLVKESLENLFKIDEAVNTISANTDGRQPKSRKKAVTFVTEEVRISPNLACTLIANMITSAECRLTLLANHRNSLIALLDSPIPVLDRFDAYFARTDGALTKNDLSLYFEVHALFLRLAAFLCTATEKKNGNEQVTADPVLQLINKTLSWCCVSLLPHLSDENMDCKDFARTLSETVLKVCINLMLIGFAQKSFLDGAVELFKAVLREPDACVSLKSCVLRGVYQLMQLFKYKKLLSDDDTATLLNDLGFFSIDRVLTSLAKLVTVRADLENVENGKGTDDEIEESGLQEVSSNAQSFRTVISEVQEIILELTFPDSVILTSGMVDRLVASVLEFVLKETEVCQDENVARGNLPPLTASLLAVFSKRDTLKSVFLKQLQYCLDSDKINTISQLKGVLAILEAFTKDFAAGLFPDIYQSLDNILAEIPISDLNKAVLGDLKNQISDKLQTTSANAEVAA